MTAVNLIDCDVHPDAPRLADLLPYMAEYWQESLVVRGLENLDFSLTTDPTGSPMRARPDWRDAAGGAVRNVAGLQRTLLDPFGIRLAILNCLHAGAVMVSEDMGAVVCRALNEWIAREWLDRDPRLRASILVPLQSPALAIEEIERCAPDPRFVQVLVPVAHDLPLGRRAYWPVWKVAARHGLPVAIHAGSALRHAPTSTGWPSYFVEDYIGQAQAFESALLSLLVEGAFEEIEDLKVVLVESGVSWLPSFIWRANKTWRGVRAEVPWMRREPGATIRRHVRLTTQPLNVPNDPVRIARLMAQLAEPDLLLFSTDHPHWHFDGLAALPDGIPPDLLQRIGCDNALATYPRMSGRAAAPKDAAA